jgi:Uma2 family endonuclease
VELIDGEIVQRPMARAEHSLALGAVADATLSLRGTSAPGGGWRIIPQISVRYGAHQCPSHDPAGWRRERVPERPRGIMTLPPDWVCETLSPGHGRKDLVHHLILLQRSGVPHYWILSPEDRSLIAYALEGGSYRVCYCAEQPAAGPAIRARIPPFEAVEIDLGAVFGID